MSSYSYSLTPVSYSVPILHAAAYPSSTVIGAFLSSSPSTASEQVVDDAVPLIHLYTSLSPMMEAGMSLLEAYSSGRGKRVVGIYVARAEGQGLGRAGERVLTALKQRFDGAFGLALDSGKLADDGFAYVPYTQAPQSSNSKSAAAWSPLAPPHTFVLPSPTLPSELLKAIRGSRVHRDVRDFDDHLEDSSCDWLENAVVKQNLLECIT